MAKKRSRRRNLEANEAFLQYEEEIANHPAYAGMPDLRHSDGTIQWEPHQTEVQGFSSSLTTGVTNGG